MMDESHPFFKKLQNSKNILLVRDEVGKARKSVRDLPNDSYAYGSKFQKDQEGAGAVISSWQVHNPTCISNKVKDFKKLNRMSLNQKLITAKQVSTFVKENDVRLKEKRYHLQKGFKSLSGDYFGSRNRPSTPIDQVINYVYGNEAANQKKRIYEQNLSKSPPKKAQSIEFEFERSKSIEIKSDFKMKKFQIVKSKLAENPLNKRKLN